MRLGKTLGLLVVLLAMALATAACGEKQVPPGGQQTTAAEEVPPVDENLDDDEEDEEEEEEDGDLPGDPDAGREIFARNCAACHGANGEGGIGPGFQGIKDRLAVEDHLMVVTNGRNAMPAWRGQLNEDDINNVVAYERTIE